LKLVKSYLTENPCYSKNLARTDARYISFQDNGPKGLMLHSVGCPQPSANVFIKNWNKASYDRACVHAFIDANTGIIYQTLPWNFRGWHGGGTSNNTYIGVEMCEPSCIKYTGGANFSVTNEELARQAVERTYNAAV
jgi:N-acetylmuramoyl-L-alanine amidase CwlA